MTNVVFCFFLEKWDPFLTNICYVNVHNVYHIILFNVAELVFWFRSLSRNFGIFIVLLIICCIEFVQNSCLTSFKALTLFYINCEHFEAWFCKF